MAKVPHKTTKCPRCLPHDKGAIFNLRYTILNEAAYSEGEAEAEWGDVWECANCGFRKAPRPKVRIDYATCDLSHAEAAKKLSRWDLCRYHLFNERGLMAEWSAFGKLIDAATAEGIVRTGFYLVYGPTGYHRDQLSKLAFQKKVKAFNVHYTVAAIRKAIDEGREELARRAEEKGRTLADLEALVK